MWFVKLLRDLILHQVCRWPTCIHINISLTELQLERVDIFLHYLYTTQASYYSNNKFLWVVAELCQNVLVRNGMEKGSHSKLIIFSTKINQVRHLVFYNIIVKCTIDFSSSHIQHTAIVVSDYFFLLSVHCKFSDYYYMDKNKEL